ncbi:MAG: hypothetical protein ACP5SH_17260 [Syntrophobacteraceae bacterium]
MEREEKDAWNAELERLEEHFCCSRPPGSVPARAVFLPDREWLKWTWYGRACFAFMWFVVVGPDLKSIFSSAQAKFERAYWHLFKGDGFLLPAGIFLVPWALFWWMGRPVPEVVFMGLAAACWIASLRADLRVRKLTELDEKELQ